MCVCLAFNVGSGASEEVDQSRVVISDTQWLEVMGTGMVEDKHCTIADQSEIERE